MNHRDSGAVNDLRSAFAAVLAGRSLRATEAESAMAEVLDGAAPEALVAGFLVALKLKGEAAGELTGGARAMRARARALELDGGAVLDTAGTGGDGAGTFNISTGAALVAAAAGVPVAKHGNRAISGRVGAADVLERMGVRIDLDPEGLRRCLRAAGCCFIFAPAYHPALARLAGLRRALGVRTLFNLIAPLSNPARPRRQLMGVAEPRLVRLMAEALAALGVEHAMVVHGADGLDELSLAGPTRVAEVRGTAIHEYEMRPQQLGIEPGDAAALAAADPEAATEVLRRTLAGAPGAAQDVLALNAAAAIYVGGRAASLEEGVALARAILASGRALDVVERMRRASQGEPA
ncbi:MAG TPA: anthranilate phosphoribosyltransferase [Candidatus Binataceae bacterium]|nr:anthranilate phosphoribosyltransferase [Candidatus Binataceae bacterium]